ncbi:MAG: hypothetical protein PHE56_15885 [Bacteroidales bacterium]|nr:hypothetical protein [Bacteroidales bacterium]
MSLTVTEGLTVTVLPNSDHEFLMTSKEVANGYGVSPYSIRSTSSRHAAEIIEGKHYVSAVAICNGKAKSALNLPHNTVLWTKRGIVRLGFFIKSERAKLFRDWAEELIIKFEEQKDLFGVEVKNRQLPAKRKINRLSQERLLNIMADVCEIEDKELRLKISTKLMGGLEYGN